jgi:hypothetical protein
LKRTTPELPEQLAQQMDVMQFSYGSMIDKFQIVVATTRLKNAGEGKIDIQQAVDGSLKMFENAGAQNIITQKDKFITPNGAEGLKVFGTMDVPVLKTDQIEKGKYVILGFTAENVIQQIMIFYKQTDVYAEQMLERIINSVELKDAEK